MAIQSTDSLPMIMDELKYEVEYRGKSLDCELCSTLLNDIEQKVSEALNEINALGKKAIKERDLVGAARKRKEALQIKEELDWFVAQNRYGSAHAK